MDRIYTDIACVINAGVMTAVVLSGETKEEDLSDSEFKADYFFRDINKLYNELS